MPEGLMAPLRIVTQRSLAHWLLVAATWLVILCATTLLAIGVLYGDAVALSGLHQRLADEPAAATAVEVQMRAEPAELVAVDEVVAGQSGRILGWADGEVTRRVRAGTFDLTAGVSTIGERDLAVIGAIEHLERHAVLRDGSWPTPGDSPIQASLSASAADQLALGIGDVVSLASRSGAERELDVRITGVWEPADADDGYWIADSLELAGVSEGASFTEHGPFVVTDRDLVEVVARSRVDVSWRTVPSFASLALENVRSMRGDAAALERRIRAELGDRAFFSVTTDLPAVLAAAERSLLVSRSGVGVLTVQFAILAGYALVLVAGLMAEQRRIETALMRSRGAGPLHVAALAGLEAVLLVVPAAIAAPWVALAALGLFDVVGPLAATGLSIQPRIDVAVVVATAVAAVAALIGLVLPALAAGSGLATVRQSMARQGGQSLAQRLGIDMALIVLAVIGLWQLRQYGAPITASVRGELGLDPLLIAAPAIALVAGAIVALRLVPLLAEVGERLAERRAGLVAPLGARQVARRPLRYTRSALLLVLAAALATFASAYTGTRSQSQADQATYRTGSDVRAEVSNFPDLPTWAIGRAYRAIDGVTAALPVANDAFDVAGRVSGGQLVAVDAAALAETVEVREDLLAGITVDDLAQRLAGPTIDSGAIDVPGSPDELTLVMSSTLESVPRERPDEPGAFDFTGSLPAGFPIGQVSIVVRDADGMVHLVAASRRLVASGAGQEIDVALTADVGGADAARMAHPLELLGVDVTLQGPADTRIAGEIRVDAARLGSDSATSQPFDLPLADAGWSWVVQQATAPDLAGADPERLEIALDRPIFGDEGPAALRLRSIALVAAATEPIPAIIGRSMAETTNARPGDRVGIGSLTRRLEVEVMGVIDGFPTVDPGQAFAVVDLERLSMATYARSGQLPFVDEWWLRAGAPASVAATLSRDLYSTEAVTTAADVARELSDDPVALGIVGALAIGSVAALIVAVIGFAVSAVVGTRERLAEFALLRALGLSSSQLSGWLSLEFAFLLAIGAAAGSALGLLLAWLVLPFVTLTEAAEVAVPPVLVSVPWTAIVVIHLLAAGALVTAVIATGRVVRRVPVAGVLRSGED